MKIDPNKMEIALARQCMDMQSLYTRGISSQTVFRLKHGGELRPKTVGRIAKLLEVDPTEIIQEDTQ